MKLQQLLTPEEIADLVRVEVEQVVTWIRQDELDAIEIMPGVMRVNPTDLRKFLLVRRRQFQPGGWRARAAE